MRGGGYGKQNLWFDSLVSSRKPFGFDTTFRGKEQSSTANPIKIYTTKSVGYVNKVDIARNTEWVDKYKVYISKAYGAGGEIPSIILGKPILGKPNTCCSETYLVIGPFDSEQTARNVQDYMTTKFFRFCVSLLKTTQDGTQKVYKIVPIMDFNKKWTDDKLYKHFGLTQDEIDYIEYMIRPMEFNDGR